VDGDFGEKNNEINCACNNEFMMEIISSPFAKSVALKFVVTNFSYYLSDFFQFILFVYPEHEELCVMIRINIYFVSYLADTDECKDRRLNSCSQICKNTYRSYTCDCKPGYTMDSSNNNCHGKKKHIFIFLSLPF